MDQKQGKRCLLESQLGLCEWVEMHVNSLRVGPPQMHPKMVWRGAECLPASVTPVRLRYVAYLSVGWHRGVTFSTHLDIPQL